ARGQAPDVGRLRGRSASAEFAPGFEGSKPLSLDDRPIRSPTAPVVLGLGTGSYGTTRMGSPTTVFKPLDSAPPVMRRSDGLGRSWTPASTAAALVALRAPLPLRLLTRTQRCSVCLEHVANADCVVLEECGRDAHVSC
ncbi:unnamed protein product, partial [Prorocentrum cordatum]